MKASPTPFFVGSLLVAVALTAQEGPTTLQFNFSNPGARSLGFGGAFAALADDATAAFANPAGLVQLTKSEVSFEGRTWDYSTPFTEGGRLSGSPTGLLLDNTSGLRIGSSSETVSGLSFASAVLPRGNWSFAIYAHQSANFALVSETQGFFAEDPFAPQATTRDDDFRISTDFEMVNYGFSVGYRLSDSLSLGVGASYAVGEMTSTRELFVPIEATLPQGPFGRNAYSPLGREITQTLGIDDADLTLNFGVLWQLSPTWSLGAFYRLGPELDLQIQTVTGPAETELPVGTVRASFLIPIDFPGVLGVGVAHKLRDDTVTLSFEWDRVEYSTIIDGPLRDLGIEDLALDDGDELHLGFEFVFLRSTPIIALRAGAWFDPDHRIRSIGDDPITRALLRSEGDSLHYAGGFGLAFRAFQVDFGVDLSDVVDTASVSAIFGF